MSGEHKYRDLALQVGGLDANRLVALQIRKSLLRNPKKCKIGCTAAEICKEGYGSRRALLPLMMVRS
jgi:hypothetical protein